MRKIAATLLLLAGAAFAQSGAIRSNAGFKANTLARNDDGSTGLVPLGFSINFFGRSRTHTFVNNNGNLTFDAALSTFTPFGLTSTRREIVAAFFADVDTRSTLSQQVTYGTDTIDGHKAFGANYINVGYYNIHADKLNSFQIVLIDRSETGEGNFDIEYNYARISWETGDASGGVNGLGGVPAAVGWSNGSGEPGTSFELDGSLEVGAFLDGARRGLVRNRLNTTVSGRYIFRARNGQILPPLTIITGCPLPSAFVGAPYAQQFNGVGALSYRWSAVADPGASLVPGLTFSQGGLLSGIPTATGTTEFTIRLTAQTDDGEQTISKRCSLTVQPPSLTITSACPLPNATVGQTYSRSLQAIGGRPPYTWSLADGSSPLPAGLSLSSNGAVTGVPREAGTSLVTFVANSNPADGATPATKTCAITVNASLLSLTSGCSLPRGTLGVPYSQALTVSGGVAPYSWYATSQLPSGLALSLDGVLSGAPASTGGSFGVRVRDSRGTASDQVCTLDISNPVVEVTTSCPLPSGMTGSGYSQQLSARGGTPPYSWSMLGTLPSGLTLSGDGVLSGNLGSAGPAFFKFLVTDSAGNSGVKGCNMVVAQADFAITSCPLPAATVGVDYQQHLSVAGGVGPYTFTVVSGLPSGLSLTAAGYLSGRVREAGSAMPTIRAVDSRGNVATQPCGLKINASSLSISGTCPLPTARVGTAYVQRFTASGGAPPYRFVLDGRLPSGLELSQDGTVRGTPLAPDDTEFEIEAVDSVGRSVPKACSLVSSLPEMPTFRLTSIPATVNPSSNGPVATLELSRAYNLPIRGEFVITAEADTGSFEPVINRPDPRVRFSNSEQILRFTIPAGQTTLTAPIVSTGTVASLVTVKAINLSAAGIRIQTPPAPRQFRVPRAIPVITDACTSSTSTGPVLQITGYTTTRQLQLADLTYTVNQAQKKATINVADSAAEYFASDEAVRNGGAFTLSIPLILEGTGTFTPNSLTLTNSVGTTAAKTVAVCR